MVTILNTRPGTPKNTVLQYLYKLQYGFTQAFLDLFVTDANGNAKDPRVVDYYGEQEPIELGPDENMHDVMIEIIAQQAVKRGYVLGSGIMSSKQVGINHKEYGVTSRGVMRFAEVTMQETQGINMHTDAFSVKITGGPNGDVAGNSMKLLLERCPQVQIRLIVDGTGAVFDPIGVDSTALAKIVLKDDLQALDVNALHVGGFMIYRLQKHKGGHTDRGGGNHGVAAGQADKKRVGHIVQNQNDLADHCGKSQTDDRLQHGAVLKQRFFSFFHNPVPPFLKIWKKERRPRTNAAAAAIALTPFPDGIGEQASSPLTAARFFRFVCQQKLYGVASHLRHVLSM